MQAQYNKLKVTAAPETKRQRDDLLEACIRNVSAIMDMTSQLNRIHSGTIIDYEWADRLKTIEEASRMVANDAKAAIAQASE